MTFAISIWPAEHWKTLMSVGAVSDTNELKYPKEYVSFVWTVVQTALKQNFLRHLVKTALTDESLNNVQIPN